LEEDIVLEYCYYDLPSLAQFYRDKVGDLNPPSPVPRRKPALSLPKGPFAERAALQIISRILLT